MAVTITTHDGRRHRRWLIVLLLAGLSMLGPFSIDAYLPAFDAIGRDLHGTAAQTQQTLSFFLLGFAVMMLLQGALSDAYGRRPVILGSLAIFIAASAGCLWSRGLEALIVFRLIQGLSVGTGMVIGRAIIRDLFDPVDAQKMLSYMTMIFGLAPAVAPIIGGWLYVHFGWRAVFAFMLGAGVLLLILCLRFLPESLDHDKRRPFRPIPLARGYRAVLLSHHFLLLSFAATFNFAGYFLYVMAAPAFIERVLGLGPGQFAWLFIPGVSGIVTGAFLTSRIAGRVDPARIVVIGYGIMSSAALANFLYSHLASHPAVPWAVLPFACYTVGMNMTFTALILQILDLFPHARGMASSLQGFIGNFINSLVSSFLVPLLSVSAPVLSDGMILLLGAGCLCWLAYRGCLNWESRRAAIV